jgi:DNA-binding NtrC family response regulator
MTPRDSDPVVLLIDDDPGVATVIEALLKRKGIGSAYVMSAEAALPIIDRRPVDLAIIDLQMPGMGGLDFVQLAARRYPDLPVIVLTAHGSVPLAVRALQSGAVDFLEKPFDSAHLLRVVSNHLVERKARTSTQPDDAIVGESPAIVTLLERIARAAKSDATVLLRGESGTGKELVARAIHRQSRRSAAPLISLHCAAIPEQLLEAELFGHARGAFTGAERDRQGRVELARGGTLFFDELGDITPLTQTKLLRLLQERCFERIGENSQRQADVRFVAATHRPLEELVSQGKFREDLFYRLNVVPIVVPPLRERLEDVPLLVARFSKEIGREQGIAARSFEPAALRRMMAHSWPGNVRELRNLIERLVVLSSTTNITAEQVEAELALVAPRAPNSARRSTPPPRKIELDQNQLVEMLSKTQQNRALAARLLGISRRTLYNRLREFGLD